MTKTILALGTALLTVLSVTAQEGKPSVKVFSNFNYDLTTVEGETAFKEFEIKRAYLGYQYNFDDKLSAKITFDVGTDDGSVYTAFLKIAALSWNATDKLTLNFGQVGTKNFKFQEKSWGNRYIAKSVQDEQKWASSADAGLTTDYKVSNKLSIDAQVLNGEGHKTAQGDNGLFRGSLGITYTMSDRIAVRFHKDITPGEVPQSSLFVIEGQSFESASQHINTLAIAYTGNNFNLGVEKANMMNAGNILDNKKDLLSVFGKYTLSEKYSFFGRYDNLTSEEDWNLENDGNYTVFGIARQMAKGVKLSINIQSWTNAAEESEAERTLFMNLGYTF